VPVPGAGTRRDPVCNSAFEVHTGGVRDVREQGFVATLRASPRKRRQLAWLAGGAVALAALAATLLIVPNTAGDPKPITGDDPGRAEGGTGPFWIVASVLFICFLLAFAYGLVRFIWRMHTGDLEPVASDGDMWRSSRDDLQEAMRSSSK
jgi:hypothetical protein